MLKTPKTRGPAGRTRAAAAQRASRARGGPGSTVTGPDRLNDSPRMAAQRQQMRPAVSAAQRRDPEDEILQGKRAGDTLRHRGPGSAAHRTGGELAPQRPTANSTPSDGRLPDSLRAGIESLSGMDLSHVRVHSNSAEPARLNALAFTQGQDIHLAPGEEAHLPHEAWHVVQQMQGRVRPTLDVDGTPVNDAPALEHEADVMGAAAQRVPPHDGTG